MKFVIFIIGMSARLVIPVALFYSSFIAILGDPFRPTAQKVLLPLWDKVID